MSLSSSRWMNRLQKGTDLHRQEEDGIFTLPLRIFTSMGLHQWENNIERMFTSPQRIFTSMNLHLATLTDRPPPRWIDLRLNASTLWVSELVWVLWVLVEMGVGGWNCGWFVVGLGLVWIFFFFFVFVFDLFCWNCGWFVYWFMVWFWVWFWLISGKIVAMSLVDWWWICSDGFSGLRINL